MALVAFVACKKGGGGGGGTPPVAPNDPPVITVPAGLAGSGPGYSLALPTGSTSILTFTAVDPDGEALLWQLTGGEPAAIGATFTTPVTGGTFVLALDTVLAPAAATVNLLVEDPRGGAAAIDLQVVRSGAPVLTSIEPTSAFSTRPQQVTLRGSALSLAGTAKAVPRFALSAGTGVVWTGEQRIDCATPTPGTLGANEVSVTNAYGTAALAASEFTMLRYPPVLGDADTALDSGAGSDLVVAGRDRTIQAVWVEGGTVWQRATSDSGVSWSPAQALSGGEVPAQLDVAVGEGVVAVAWIGDGSNLYVRTSIDDGASFLPSSVLGPLAGSPVSAPQLAVDGTTCHCAWLGGDPLQNAQRVTVASSTDAGSSWTAPLTIAGSDGNQPEFAVDCEGDVAWILFRDQRVLSPGPGIYSVRSADGGATWSSAVRRSGSSAAFHAPRVCHSGDRVHFVWLGSGGLFGLTSIDGGIGWPATATVLRGNDPGTLAEPAVACELDRLFVVCTAGGSNVVLTRVGAAGAAPEYLTLSSGTDPVAGPRLGVRGNYVFAAWQSGDVAGNAARILLATSPDIGTTFLAPVGFGDGAANQQAPQLVVDSARLWLGWRDSRGPNPALFCNRTAQ